MASIYPDRGSRGRLKGNCWNPCGTTGNASLPGSRRKGIGSLCWIAEIYLIRWKTEEHFGFLKEGDSLGR
jgi:hypothetical protein